MSDKDEVGFTEITVDDYDVSIFEWDSMNTVDIPIDEWDAVKNTVDKLIADRQSKSESKKNNINHK